MDDSRCDTVLSLTQSIEKVDSTIAGYVHEVSVVHCKSLGRVELVRGDWRAIVILGFVEPKRDGSVSGGVEHGSWRCIWDTCG